MKKFFWKEKSGNHVPGMYPDIRFTIFDIRKFCRSFEMPYIVYRISGKFCRALAGRAKFLRRGWDLNPR